MTSAFIRPCEQDGAGCMTSAFIRPCEKDRAGCMTSVAVSRSLDPVKRTGRAV